LGSAVPRFAHTNFTYVVDISDGEKAREIQHRFFREVMGPTHDNPKQLDLTNELIVPQLD